jgi:hypothetical protein
VARPLPASKHIKCGTGAGSSQPTLPPNHTLSPDLTEHHHEVHHALHHRPPCSRRRRGTHCVWSVPNGSVYPGRFPLALAFTTVLSVTQDATPSLWRATPRPGSRSGLSRRQPRQPRSSGATPRWGRAARPAQRSRCSLPRPKHPALAATEGRHECMNACILCLTRIRVPL